MTHAAGTSDLHEVTHDGAHPPAAPTRRRAWAAFLVTAAAFVATTAAVGALVPARAWLDPPLRAKMDVFAAGKDEIDLLLLGSSHLYRGIDPRVLDARLAERGHRVRSHNLAYAGLGPIEADGILAQALAMKPSRVRWVVAELIDPRPKLSYRGTLRAVAWHDARATAQAVRAAARCNLPAAQRAEYAAEHLAAFTERISSLGIGPETLRVVRGLEDDDYRALVQAVLPRHGFLPYEAQFVEVGGEDRRHQFLAKTGAYLSEVGRATTGDRTARRRRGRSVALTAPWLRAQRERVRAAGAELVYVTGPQLDKAPLSAGNLGADAPVVLDFDDPAAYPELFAVEHRFDSTHLNARGAELFSRRLADALADRVLRRAP